MACLSRVTIQSVLMSNAKSCIIVGESPGRSRMDRELTQFLVKYREINLRVMWWCRSQLKNNVEQRTIFRQGNHISMYFTTIIFNLLKQILAISFICWVKTYLDFIGIKEINLFLWKMQKLQEINKKQLKAVWPDCKQQHNRKRTNINAEVNIKYCMTLNKQSQGQGQKWRLQFSRSHQGL